MHNLLHYSKFYWGINKRFTCFFQKMNVFFVYIPETLTLTHKRKEKKRKMSYAIGQFVQKQI